MGADDDSFGGDSPHYAGAHQDLQRVVDAAFRQLRFPSYRSGVGFAVLDQRAIDRPLVVTETV